MSVLRQPRQTQHLRQQLPMVQTDREFFESQPFEYVARRGAQLGFDDERGRADAVHVALVEFTRASAGRTIGAPHGLNLISLEDLGQLRLVFGDDTRERYG